MPGKPVPTPVRAGEPAGGIQRDAQRVAEQRAEHAAMGHDDDLFAAVPTGQFFKAGQGAGAMLAAAFPTGDDVVRIATVEEPVFVGELLLDLRSGQTLEYPEMPFAQAGVQLQAEARLVSDNLGGLTGAAEVAAVERA